MDASNNPYDWRRHRPQVEVTRPNVAEVADDLRRGGSGVLIAGRGMGKSVFLRQLHTALAEDADVDVVLFPGPPTDLVARELLRDLARRVGVEDAEPHGAHEVVEAYLARPGAPGRLVLLYDELDRYGHGRGAVAETPGRSFFNNLELARRDFPELGVLAAGSIGVFSFRDSLGSSFLARATRVRLSPFGSVEVEELARPFADRGEALASETLQAMLLASGGNPALVTYGLEGLWSLPEPTVDQVARIYSRFQRDQAEFLNDFQLSFSDPALSEAPQRIWELIRTTVGPYSHDDLRRACVSPNGALRLDFADVLDLLEAAGLVEVSGSTNADPVTVRPVTSILSLPQASAPSGEIRERLLKDLETLLGRLHAAAADFFRPGPEGQGKRLVPESVFSTFLALGFDLLGWQVEREAQQGAGRTDLLMRWNGSEELAVVEVKIWGRGEHQRAHRQVESYWSHKVQADAVVMLTDAEVSDWPGVYRETCLVPLGVNAEERRDPDSPVRARFRCRSRSADEMDVDVEHFLVRVPRGR